MLKRLMSFQGFSSVAMLIWGVLLSLPFSTFSTTPSYAAMANFYEQFGATVQQSEMIWGLGLLAVGIYRSAALLSSNHKHMLVSSYLGCGAWIFLAAMLLLAAPRTTGGYIYMLIALYDISHITRRTQGGY